MLLRRYALGPARLADQVARLIARRDRLATAPRCGKQENEMETAHRSDQVREGSSPCL